MSQSPLSDSMNLTGQASQNHARLPETHVELNHFGVPVIQHLPGVGLGFQDHPGVCCLWECPDSLPSRPAPEVVIFWKSKTGLGSPDLQILPTVLSAGDAARLGLPAGGWALLGIVVQPKSRGRIRLTGSDPADPVQIEANYLCDSDDREALSACLELSREIGNSGALRPFIKREIIPGNLKSPELENYIRDGAFSFWHQTSTAKMGRHETCVVDADLKVPTHGSERSRESFSVHTAKNVWACHSASCREARQGCVGGNVLDLVALLERCSIREAALHLQSEWPTENRPCEQL